MVPMALLGAFRYWRNPEVELNGLVIALIVLGAMAGTMIGTELVARLPAGVLRKVFAVFLVLVAVRMFTAAPHSKELDRNTHAGAKDHAPASDPGNRNDSSDGR